MKTRRVLAVAGLFLGCALLAASLAACGGGGTTPADTKTHVAGQSKEEIGKYLVMIGGCNDCHTPGVMEGKVLKDIPEDLWLTGSPLGFNGPWGTSYATNLRQRLAPYNEAMFLVAMRKHDQRPPMPWASLHAMTDEDLGAVLAYVKSLPVKGVNMPEPLPAGKEPPQPFIVMVPGVSPAFGSGAVAPPASAPSEPTLSAATLVVCRG